MKIKICSICKEEKDLETEFYSNGKTPNGTQKYKPYCKPCEMRKKQTDHWDKIKKVLNVNIVKCSKCGYDKNYAALEFHHLYDKDLNISQLKRYSIERYKIELEKCIVLCSNCHREEHNKNLMQD